MRIIESDPDQTAESEVTWLTGVLVCVYVHNGSSTIDGETFELRDDTNRGGRGHMDR